MKTFATIKESVNNSPDFQVMSRIAFNHKGETRWEITVKKARSKKLSHLVEYENGRYSESQVY